MMKIIVILNSIVLMDQWIKVWITEEVNNWLTVWMLAASSDYDTTSPPQPANCLVYVGNKPKINDNVYSRDRVLSNVITIYLENLTTTE